MQVCGRRCCASPGTAPSARLCSRYALAGQSTHRADEIVERRYIYTYDGEGNRLTKSEDGLLRPADGQIDHTWEYRPPCPREVWQASACRDEDLETVEIPVE